MKELYCIFLAGAVVGFLLIGCQKDINPVKSSIADQSDVGSLAKPVVFTDNYTYYIDNYQVNPCAMGGAGEIVHFTGEVFFLLHITQWENTFFVKIQEQPRRITGVGLTSGDTYIITGVTQQTYKELKGYSENGQCTITFLGNGGYVTKGPSDNLWSMGWRWHVNVSAAGEVNIQLGDLIVICK